jgi:hypothetical protein
MNQRSIFASLSLLLLLTPQLMIRADPKGEQLVNQYLNQSARRSAIFKMGVDYQEAGKEAIHLEFTWMRKGKRRLRKKASCFSSMRNLMETQTTLHIDPTVLSRRKSGCLEPEIINTKDSLFQSRN